MVPVGGMENISPSLEHSWFSEPVKPKSAVYLVLGIVLTLGGLAEIITQRAGKITAPPVHGMQAIVGGFGTMIVGLMFVEMWRRK